MQIQRSERGSRIDRQRNPRSRRLLAVGVVAGTCMTALTATSFDPTAASATPGAVSCYGDYCSGQGPAATGCGADAITIAALQDDRGSGRLELRWSPTCKTNWARWQQYPTGWCLNCSPLDLLAVQDTGYTQSLVFSESDGGTPTQGGEPDWTPMIYSPQHAVYAAMHMPCGDATILSAAMDCAMSSLERTDAG